jgi:hypothetical protein
MRVTSYRASAYSFLFHFARFVHMAFLAVQKGIFRASKMQIWNVHSLWLCMTDYQDALAACFGKLDWSDLLSLALK